LVGYPPHVRDGPRNTFRCKVRNNDINEAFVLLFAPSS
jgi:hypothetical protein